MRSGSLVLRLMWARLLAGGRVRTLDSDVGASV